MMAVVCASLLATGAVAWAGPTLGSNLGSKMRGDLPHLLRNAEAGEMFNINIIMRDQVRPLAGDLDLRALPKAERRQAVIDMLKPHAARTQANVVAFLRNQEALGTVENIQTLWLTNVVHARMTPAVARQVAARADVAYIHLDVTLGEEVFPVRPGGDVLDGGNIECGVDLMGADEVWSTYNITGRNVVVDIIDTGACITHPDLANQIWVNADEIPGNNIDDDNNGFIDDINGWSFDGNGSNSNITDTNGHGTHTGGTVVGDGANGTTTGMAPDAELQVLKFWNNFGGEWSVWQGMQYGIDNGAHVITASLGWPHSVNPDRATWRANCENAMAAGLVVIYAAGNEGGGNPPDNVRTPGDVPDMITVGATDCNDAIAWFSSRGPITWQDVPQYGDWPYPPGKIKPTISAPGVNTISTSNNCTGYRSLSGTSMATPHVAGAVALILEANPNLDHWQVKQILEDTAIDLGAPGKDNDFGSGRVDALAAVEMALSMNTAILPQTFSVNAGVLQSGGLSDLYNSDDSYLVVRQRAAVTPSMPVVQVEVEGVSNVDNASQLSFTMEASAGAVPANIMQTIEMFNFVTNSWEQVDQRTATMTDSVVVVTITTDPDRFIQNGTGAVISRMSWFDSGTTLFPNWSVRIDQSVWAAEE